MTKLNTFLKNNKEKLLIVYLFLQPIIDLVTSLCMNIWHINLTIGMFIRFLFLALLLYYFFFINKTKTKKKKTLYLGVILVYIFLFIIQIISLKGIDSLFYEFQNLIRCFYFPICLILLIDMFEEKKLEITHNHWVSLFLIYIILIFIPTITNTGFNGYTQGKVGNIGWFNSSNEISAIISLLLPLFLYGISKQKNKIITIIEILITLYVIFNLGSKIVILSLFIIIIYYGIIYLKKWLKNYDFKKLGILGILTVLFLVISILVVPKTNFYKNIKTHLDFLEVDSITDVFTSPKLFDHFVFSSRLTFLNNTANNYLNSNLSEKFLGIGYIENYGTDQVSLKMIEMDPFDIFFRHGIIGFIIYFLPLMYNFIELKNKKFKDENQSKNILLAIIIGIIIMNLSGHLLTSPAVSIYLAIFIALLSCGKQKTRKSKLVMK